MDSVTASVSVAEVDKVIGSATSLLQQDTTSVIVKIVALLILAGAYIWYQNWKKNKEIADARNTEEINRATTIQLSKDQNKIETNQGQTDKKAVDDFFNKQQ
jgi:hypothetical protein